MRLCSSCGACFEDGYDLCAYDGRPLEDSFLGPRVLAGRYLLEQRVAGGAMGTVFRATHLQIGSPVAVKLMQPRREALQVGLARFHREAQILGQIKHPNAVLVMDFGVEERPPAAVPYLVTEFLRGEPLSAVLEREGRFDLRQAERVISPVCDAVEEAHQIGVIHRDLKPSNIFLERLRDGSDVVKVLDFGIAKFVEIAPEVLDQLRRDNVAWVEAYHRSFDVDQLEEVADVRRGELTLQERRADVRGPGVAVPVEWTITDAGFMIGTVPYMAPEQMTGERVSRRTDIYGIATLLFRLLTGRLPYEGGDDDIIMGKLGDDPPTLGEFGVEAPDELEEILRRALSQDPSDRPESALEISEVVRRSVFPRSAPPAVDAPRDLGAQLTATTQLLEEIDAAVTLFAQTPGRLEVGYLEARDSILGLGASLSRVGRLIDLLPTELTERQARGLGRAVEGWGVILDRVGRALHRLAAGRDDEFGDYLLAIWSRAQGVAEHHTRRLRAHVEAPGRAALSLGEVDDPFAALAEDGGVGLEERARRLSADDPLERSDALEALLSEGVDRLFPFLAQGMQRTTPLMEQLVAGLWQSADVLLLMELFPRGPQPRLLPLLVRLSAVAAGQPFGLLSELFAGRDEGHRTAYQRIESTLSRLKDESDRRVLWRCLLVHPHAGVRERAVTALPLSELWNAVTYERTPVSTLCTIFAHGTAVGAPDEYLKIFLLCVQERLAAVNHKEEIDEAFVLLERFFAVPCFHEDVVFEPLLNLDRALRARAGEIGTPPSELGRYDELVADFRAGGVTDSVALAQMRDIPLPIQRKLAREGRFIDHFVCHPNERVARETIPHILRRDSVIRYLRMVTIHRAVLVELARHRHLFRRSAVRLALLHNPKTTAQIARNYLPLLAHEQIRLLSRNRHVSHEVRALARRYVERLNLRVE